MIPAAEDGHGDRFAEWDSAYVLGALSPSDRRAYERHLAECDTCRAAVAELAGLPGLLSTLSARHAETLVAEEPAPVVPLATLATAVRRSRVRRRTLGAVAASALVVAGAVGGTALAGAGWFGSPDGVSAAPSSITAADGRTIDLRPVDGADMRAQVVATPTTWGTKFRWSCHYPPAPGETPPGEAPPDGGYVPPEPIRYELVLVGRDGARTVAATWSWSGGETTGLDASTAVSLTDMDRIEITLDGDEEALASATL